MATVAVTLQEALQKANPVQRKAFFKFWSKKLLNLTTDVAYDADHYIGIIKHNNLEDLLIFLVIRNDDLPALTKPNPTAGQPDLPLGIMERKTIQSLIAYYHHQSNKKRKLLCPNDTSFTAADFVQFRIRPDTSIVPFGSATEQDQKEADEFMKKIKPSYSNCPVLTEEHLFLKQSKLFNSIVIAQGMSDCFEDPDTFKPDNKILDRKRQRLLELRIECQSLSIGECLFR